MNSWNYIQAHPGSWQTIMSLITLLPSYVFPFSPLLPFSASCFPSYSCSLLPWKTMQSAAEIADSLFQGEAVCGSVCCKVWLCMSAVLSTQWLLEISTISSFSFYVFLLSPAISTSHLSLHSFALRFCPFSENLKPKAEAVINLFTFHGSLMKYMKQYSDTLNKLH